MATTADIRTLPRGYEVSRYGSWASAEPGRLINGQHDLRCFSTNASVLLNEWLSLNPLAQICAFDLPSPCNCGDLAGASQIVMDSRICGSQNPCNSCYSYQPWSNQSIFTVAGAVSGNFQHVFTSGHGFPRACGVEWIGTRAEQ